LSLKSRRANNLFPECKFSELSAVLSKQEIKSFSSYYSFSDTTPILFDASNSKTLFSSSLSLILNFFEACFTAESLHKYYASCFQCINATARFLILSICLCCFKLCFCSKSFLVYRWRCSCSRMLPTSKRDAAMLPLWIRLKYKDMESENVWHARACHSLATHLSNVDVLSSDFCSLNLFSTWFAQI
jgi:hypothetical protein